MREGPVLERVLAHAVCAIKLLELNTPKVWSTYFCVL